MISCALAAADRGHGVDRLDTGLERLRDRLAFHHRRSLYSSRRRSGGLDRALAVERIAERVDHPAEQGVADRNRQHAAGRSDGVAFLDVARITHDDRTDRVLIEVEGDTEESAGELQQLGGHRVRADRHPGDAVTDGEDIPHRLGFQAGFQPARWERSAAAMSSVLSVSSAIVRQPHCSRSSSNRPRINPSSTVSPTLVTSPPTTDGSTMTFTWTRLFVARGAPCSRVIWSDANGIGDRTSATTSPSASAAMSASRRAMSPRLRPGRRPRGTTSTRR